MCRKKVESHYSPVKEEEDSKEWSYSGDRGIIYCRNTTPDGLEIEDGSGRLEVLKRQGWNEWRGNVKDHFWRRICRSFLDNLTRGLNEKEVERTESLVGYLTRQDHF